MEFSRLEYWSGLPFPPPGDLPDQGVNPGPLHRRQILLPSEPLGKAKTLQSAAPLPVISGSLSLSRFPCSFLVNSGFCGIFRDPPLPTPGVTAPPGASPLACPTGRPAPQWSRWVAVGLPSIQAPGRISSSPARSWCPFNWSILRDLKQPLACCPLHKPPR